MAIALDEDHAVLVGAQAREDVLLAHGAAQQRADLDQHLVGHVQAGAVVELAEAVDVDEGDGQRAVVALGARDLLGQALAEGAVVGQAGERVGGRLGVQPRAILGVGHRGGDEVGVILQALLGPGRELVRVVGHHDERAPHRGAGAHRGGQAHAVVLAVHPVARDGLAGSAGGRAGCPGARRRCRRDLRAVLVVRPAAEDGDAVGVLEADDGGAVGARAGARRPSETSAKMPAGGEPAATAVATRRSDDCSSVRRRCCASSSRARRSGAGEQLAPGDHDAADQAVHGHDDDELAREVAARRRGRRRASGSAWTTPQASQ